jgi:hypothetical protein
MDSLALHALEGRNVYSASVGYPEGKRSLRRPSDRRQVGIIMDRGERAGGGGVIDSRGSLF